MRKFLAISLILFLVSSCAPKSVDSSGKDKPKPDVSATEVVKRFLNALKSEQYEKAFDYIYIVSSDREGYASRMRSLSYEHGIKLIDYRILGTQLFKETAIIVAELEVSHKDQQTGEIITKKTRNRYDLAVIEGRWKITKDSCIENCR